MTPAQPCVSAECWSEFNGTHAPEATARKTAAAKVERPARVKDEITFLPAAVLYRLTRDTILVTRRDGARILIPKRDSSPRCRRYPRRYGPWWFLAEEIRMA